jgi:protein-S-isoprenylcysteine O-methyltransferase Ste14
VWLQSRHLPLGPPTGAWGDWLGAGLVVLGLALMAAAVIEFNRHKTTPIPHMEASALVSTGVFGWSRNPIYLGDVLVLAGLILRWDALPSLVILPVFAWVLTVRFIRPEEARLRASFPAEFDAYAARVRRWL